jgi:hypothetical protein
MHKKTVYRSTYNSCKDGNVVSQTRISPIILLFCNCLHMWKANLMIMHELNGIAKLDQNQVINCQYSDNGLVTNKSFL